MIYKPDDSCNKFRREKLVRIVGQLILQSFDEFAAYPVLCGEISYVAVNYINAFGLQFFKKDGLLFSIMAHPGKNRVEPDAFRKVLFVDDNRGFGFHEYMLQDVQPL